MDGARSRRMASRQGTILTRCEYLLISPGLAEVNRARHDYISGKSQVGVIEAATGTPRNVTADIWLINSSRRGSPGPCESEVVHLVTEVDQ